MVKTIWSRLLVSLMWAVMSAALLIPAAYTERGYWACGGECLLIVMVFISVLFFTGSGVRK